MACSPDQRQLCLVIEIQMLLGMLYAADCRGIHIYTSVMDPNQLN